jgi:predicted HicB family RNase H-like nuclease
MSKTVKSTTKKTFPLEIEESLHKALKHKVIESNKSLHAYIIDALISQINKESPAYNIDNKAEVGRRKK